MKNFLFAGGNSGVGLETVKLLSDRDDISIRCLVRDTEGLPDSVSSQKYDLDKPGELELPDQLDGFVYFPGTITLKPFHQLSPEQFREDLDINFSGAVRLLQTILPSLKKSGQASVVLFSTVAVTTGMPYHASIASAKGAVEGLARSLAAEWAPRIRVNAIAPSLTDSPMASTLLNSDKKVETSVNRHPLQAVGQPADTAKLVSFLLSDASKFMTGQILRPDGGLSSLRLL